MKDTLANTEKKTAYILTLPAVALVFAIILFPIFANVWISFKEVELKDIRIPEPRAKKIVKSISEDPSKIKILYKNLQLSSNSKPYIVPLIIYKRSGNQKVRYIKNILIKNEDLRKDKLTMYVSKWINVFCVNLLIKFTRRPQLRS